MKNSYLWMLLFAAVVPPIAAAPIHPKAARTAQHAPLLPPPPTCTIQGIVTYGPTGKPAPNVQIMVALHDEMGLTQWGVGTDAHGRFRDADINPGRYSYGTDANDNTVLGPKDWVAPTRWIDLKPGQVKKLRILLCHVAHITGTVTDAATRRPLPDIRIMTGDDANQEINTDGHGHYQAYVIPGSMTVMAVDPADDTHNQQKTVQVAAGAARIVDFQMTAPSAQH